MAWWRLGEGLTLQELLDHEDGKSETSERMLSINWILNRLNKLRDDTEKEELEQGRADNLKSRIDKIVRQLHKLQAEESGSDSEPETEYESELDEYEEWERAKERELEPVEELTLESNDPYKLKRPRTKGGDVQNCCGGYGLLYEPALTGKDPKTLKSLQHSAKLAIDSFNKRHKTKYSLVDVVGAIVSPCAGQLLQLGFTAIQPGDAVAKNFQTKIYYGIGETVVDYVHIC